MTTNTSKPVRVRFAPSPTGFQHIGNLHSALFNYLFARHHKGVFIIRLEDTDRERFVPEAEKHLFDSLEWLGILPDESSQTGGKYGPYVQSERLTIYNKYSDELIKKGALYRCWCTPDRLTSLREQAQKDKRAFKYDRFCLEHQGDPSKPHVLRYKLPETSEPIKWDDIVLGEVQFNVADLDDFVCIKSDGFPTYHFANVVDDHLMEISHVMRAAEWIPSTPKHLLLYRSFNWDPPKFIHLPQILGADGKRKLSKRDGAKDILDYGREGYLRDAIVNFMALLGWNEGSGTTKELYSHEELVKAFTAERIQKSPATFDPERLTWMNGHYIRSLSLEELGERAKSFWHPEAAKFDPQYRRQVLGLIQERLKFLGEIPELTDFFFTDPDPLAIKEHKKVESNDIQLYLEESQKLLNTTNFDHDSLESALRGLADRLSAKPGNLFSVLRIAITGKTAAPGLFETMLVLGQKTVLNRIQQTLSVLQVDKA